ncbi:hypothetical protein N7517_006236 [Penicillium concentricum]|uniref:Alcohol dehydrogenase-like N-terminal domain-containing protein n=1 Tax=Penicillium concentricum TaxID=293559 RepID=A0A9W9VC93_9EURO|nr:uncharacterized protein N7517_006236 [Penicillium concentricum]KAJ5374230.1 hypothetical protein N7517_006236 [Penicillium concentricum]
MAVSCNGASVEVPAHDEVISTPDQYRRTITPPKIMSSTAHETTSGLTEEFDRDSGYESPPGQEKNGSNIAGKLQQITLPFMQRAVITPEMGEELNMVLRKIIVRDPAPGEVVVRIYYTGICRSDACFSVGPGPGYPKHNHVSGHEGIGAVVKSHDPSLIGHTVGIRYLGSTCGSCTYCLRGLPTSCPSQLNTPKQIAGTFQEYATVPASCVVRLPEAIWNGKIDPALCATALCSGSTALTSLRAAKVRPGDVVIVAGIGGAIGHMTGAIAKQVLRARVIGIDIKAKINKLLLKDHAQYSDFALSAPEAHDGDAWLNFHGALLRACEELRGSCGLTRAAEAVIVSSSSFSAFWRLDDYVCDGGRIVCVGVPEGENVLAIPLRSVVERNLHLSGNLMGGHREALEVVEYILSGQIKPQITIAALEDIPAQMQSIVDCETIGKVVVSI